MRKRSGKKRNRVFSKRKYFMDLKRPDQSAVAHPKSVQDTIEIRGIAPNGIFQVGEGKWSKSFLLVDVNYNTKTFDEQYVFFTDWCKTLNTFDVSVKLTVFNENRNMTEIREKILYRHKNDAYDWLRDAYNEIIESKIMEGKQGIRQEKFLTVTVERNDYEAARAYLTTLEGSLANNFAALGSALISMNANERLRVLDCFYHMGHEDEFDVDVEREIMHGLDWKNEIAPAVLDFDSEIDRFQMDDKKCAMFYIEPSSYMASLTDDFWTGLTSLPMLSVCSIDYEPIPQDAAIATMEEKLMGVENKIAKQQEKRNRAHNYSSGISYQVRREKEELERMLDDLRDNNQKMFWIGITIGLAASDDETLEDHMVSAAQVVESGAHMIPYYMRQREALSTVLPIGGRYVDMMRAMFTSSAGVFIPFHVVEMQMMDHPFYYGINQVSKEPIWANRKKLLNGNGFVFGVPGSGKSFSGCKMEVGSIFLNTEDDIIFVDPTLEYFDVAEAYGGEIINLAAYTGHYLNPLEVDLHSLNKEDTDGQIHEKCEFMLGICEQAMEGGIKPEYKSIIDRCVRKLYQGMISLPAAQRKQPIMSEFIDIIKQQEEPEAHKIALIMEIFIEGSLNIFNNPTNIDINNRVIVYGLRDLGEDLSGIAMLVMLENIRQRIIKNFKMGRATWLYVDEFHVLIGKPYSRNYFISLWKKVRKLGGLCTGITQNVVEVLNDPMTSTLVSNSEYMVLLKQSAPDAAALGRVFDNISDAQIKYTTQAIAGTGLIRFGETIIPFNNRIPKDNPVYDVYNTNMHEKAARNRARMAET